MERGWARWNRAEQTLLAVPRTLVSGGAVASRDIERDATLHRGAPSRRTTYGRDYGGRGYERGKGGDEGARGGRQVASPPTGGDDDGDGGACDTLVSRHHQRYGSPRLDPTPDSVVYPARPHRVV